jgi:hypothetical protein
MADFKVIIRFKSGFMLPVTCEKFSMRTDAVTGEITHYDINGITDNKPLFFRPEDIECIFQEMNDETETD